MKDFPKEVEGPKGIWYKKVNDVIAQAKGLKNISHLIELLGEPDIVKNENSSPASELEIVGFKSVFEVLQHQNSELTLVYQNPYKSKISYHFAVKKNKIVNFWEQSND